MPQHATISDINGELVNTYRVMSRNPARLRAHLVQHQERHSDAHYYATRAHVPNDAIERAEDRIAFTKTVFLSLLEVRKKLLPIISRYLKTLNVFLKMFYGLHKLRRLGFYSRKPNRTILLNLDQLSVS